MKLLHKILITVLMLITNYQLLITNNLFETDNRNQIRGNQFTIKNSQFTICRKTVDNQQPIIAERSRKPEDKRLQLTDNLEPIESTENSQLSTDDDTLKSREVNETLFDTLKPKPLDDFVSDVPISKKKYEMAKSPTTAVLLSLVLPGAGQFYNESYWKVPLFLGATGILTYLMIDNHNKYKTWQEKYDNPETPESEKIFYKSMKEGYRDLRDQDAFYLVGVYILAAVDAYVGAHLYDFNVTDDLTLKVHTGYINSLRIGISLNW